MCEELGLRLLGKVPLDPRIGQSCDEGRSFLNDVPDSPAAHAYNSIVKSESHECWLDETAYRSHRVSIHT